MFSDDIRSSKTKQKKHHKEKGKGLTRDKVTKEGGRTFGHSSDSGGDERGEEKREIIRTQSIKELLERG